MNQYIRINEKDNVAVLLYDARAGDTLRLPDLTVTLREQIPFGHKAALRSLNKGDVIYKYGQPIARSTREIPAGCWVHTHNCESLRGGAGG